MKAKMIEERTLAIDFDGVIHSYKRGWTGEVAEDEPMPGVEEALQKLKRDGWEIVILLSTRDSIRIWDWLEKYDLSQYIDDVTNEKIQAEVYIDDRGYRFKNWKNTLQFIDKL